MVDTTTRRRARATAAPQERIAAAAASVFAARGFEGARVDEIAEHAGINKAMLYYHVGDKEDLYAAVLVESIDRALALLRTATAAAPSPGAKLLAVLDTLAEFGTSNPEFIPIIMREVSSGGRNLPDALVARLASVFRVVSDVLAAGVKSGDFRPTDPLLTHVTLVGAFMYLRASQPIRERVARAHGLPLAGQTPIDLARLVGDLFLHGLSARPPRRSRAGKAVASGNPSPRKRSGGSR